MKTEGRFILLVLVFSLMASLVLPPGWALEEEMEFSRNNLFQYLDGGAEKFLRAGFLKLKVFYLRKGEWEAVAEVYEFERPECARLFWQNEEGEMVSLGDGGKFQPNGVVFFRGKRFFKIYSFEARTGSRAEFLSLARAFLSLP